MERDQRTKRVPAGSERETLEAFLDFQRDTLLWKVSGLTDEQLQKAWTPSGMSLHGLVKHMAYVERNWFQNRFLLRGLPIPWRDGDPGGDFRIEPGETAASVIAFYRAEIAESKRVLADVDSLEAIAKDPERPHSMRTILIHMVEETARHNGHADLMREMTDGATGE